MTFPNAHNGIKKVFTAQILQLIAVACGIAGGISGILGAVAGGVNFLETTNPESLTESQIKDILIDSVGPGLLVAGIFALAAGILFIIAYIINIVGLAQASKDEENFKGAFAAAIVSLVVSIVMLILSGVGISGGWGDNVANTVRNVCTIFIMVLVITGIQVLSDRLGEEKMVGFGNKIKIMIIINIIITAVLIIIPVFFSGFSSFAMVEGILGLIGSIISLIAHIAYIVFLGKSLRVLRK